MQAGRCRIGLFEISQHTFRTLPVGLPHIGEADAPGRAVKQPGAQSLLKGGHLLRHSRVGQVQILRRLGEAAPLRHRHEDFQSREPVHLTYPYLETILFLST